MNFIPLLDSIGADKTLALIGLAIGILFGAAAQRSQFCMRAAAIEFTQKIAGERLAIWLLAFSTAVFATQLLVTTHSVDLTEARQIGPITSLSGAIIGGLLFGSGMVLSRGCSSRLLVLSATGNLRALLGILVFAVCAQASISGVLSPLRDYLAGLVLVDGAILLQYMPPPLLGIEPTFIIGLVWFMGAIWLAKKNNVPVKNGLYAAGIGIAVAVGWFLTHNLSQQSFDPVPLESISFTGPLADSLMMILKAGEAPLDFDIGLVCGVFLGSFCAAWTGNDVKLQGFQSSHAMRSYLSGAAMMGFGGMLAGGCAVGAGITGSSVMSAPMFAALTCMWIGASATHRFLNPKNIVITYDI